MVKLTVDLLKKEAKEFAKIESTHDEPSIFGSTDGKAVGTYLEHKFKKFLSDKYFFEKGNSANGIDFPDELLNTDIKVTSISQPQSSCPFKSARQKIYGLGYNLLIFVYEKIDNNEIKKSRLNILHTIFVESEYTADYQITTSINSIMENNGNTDDIVALFSDKNLPVDEIEMNKLAKEIFKNKPKIGYLTISNALQWRLQYGRVIEKAGNVTGIERLA
jgi:hypothetical protein